jgi:hypothetical protein
MMEVYMAITGVYGNGGGGGYEPGDNEGNTERNIAKIGEGFDSAEATQEYSAMRAQKLAAEDIAFKAMKKGLDNSAGYI